MSHTRLFQLYCLCAGTEQSGHGLQSYPHTQRLRFKCDSERNGRRRKRRRRRRNSIRYWRARLSLWSCRDWLDFCCDRVSRHLSSSRILNYSELIEISNVESTARLPLPLLRRNLQPPPQTPTLRQRMMKALTRRPMLWSRLFSYSFSSLREVHSGGGSFPSIFLS